MKSIGEAQQRLPKEYVEKLYQYFTSSVADRILQGCTNDRSPSLRVNTLKADSRTIMQQLQQQGIKYNRVLWYSDGLVITNAKERRIEQLDCYHKGEIYLQSLSSMIPPLLLRPQTNEKVADLTAAPGSKSTQLACLMQNRGYILASEIDKIRVQKLQYNIEKQGASIVEVICTNGVQVGQQLPEYFNRILLDAPCSGEGLFLITQPQTYRSWRAKLVRRCISTQRRLFKSAFSALKPGGILVYSTCTLNPEENEEIVQEALDYYGEQLKILEPALKIPQAMPGLTEVRGKKMHRDLTHAIRVVPNSLYEGFFCCVLQKRRGSV